MSKLLNPMNDTQSEIQITAEPQTLPSNCLYRAVDRSLHSGLLYTSNPEFATEWMPLAAAIFAAADHVKGVRIGGHEVLVSMESTPDDWRPIAKATGAAIRAFLNGGEACVKEGAGDSMTDGDLWRNQAQKVIDAELNPNLASHGGWVEIQASDGSELYITMGGGCQGCGSAALTMKQGVETSIRNAVPDITAIHDSTDHASGQNPYM
ncbi:MAG: NifU family protein [Planctomycetota bacterium]|nr:NifU family protein [Planctomycetota bacterium]